MSTPQPYLPGIQAIADRNQTPPAHRVQDPKLPTWGDNKRGTPNSFLRCALFAATKGTERTKIEDQIVASYESLTVKYSGPLLNQSDLDVWETIVHLARKKIIGAPCSFTTYEILMALGHKNTGNTDHKWVDGIIKRLAKAYVEITHADLPDVTYFGHLIEGGKKNSRTKHYDIKLNESLLALYGSAHWTAIDWEQRKLLSGQDLAKYLHAFYSTHRKPHALSIEKLYAWCGSQNGQLAGFKRQLVQALHTLKEITFLADFSIQKNMVIVERAHPRLSSS